MVVDGGPSLILLGCSGWLIQVGCVPTPILIVLLGLLSLSPVTLIDRRSGIWTITYLMLRTVIAVAPLN